MINIRRMVCINILVASQNKQIIAHIITNKKVNTHSRSFR